MPFDVVGDGILADAEVAGDPTVASPATDGRLRGQNVDLNAGAVRIWTLKRCAEHSCEVPVPQDLFRAFKLVHSLRMLDLRATEVNGTVR